MAQQANAIQDGIDQVRKTVRGVEREFKKIQKRVETRRKAFEKRANREMKRIQKEFQKQPLVKRAETLRKDATKQWEKSVDQLVDALPVATKREVAKIDRKLNSINRKLRELERANAA
ncbi:MAG: hypothetical protein QNK03_00660 [Myxococcota bacterium]|nr:hypothetical protein [Myxococcota bacterium]